MAVVSTLVSTCLRPDFDIIIEEETVSDILIECVELLTTLLAEKDYYELFSQNYRTLLI